MILDATTLGMAGGFVTFVSGVFLLSYWWHDRMAYAALWWALGNCGLGTGIMLLALHSDLPFRALDIAMASLFDLSSVFAFVAARIFNRGSINFYRVLACVAAGIAIKIVTVGLVREQFVAALGIMTQSVVYVATAFQFWLGRDEQLRGRWPIIGAILTYAFSLVQLGVLYAAAPDYHPMPPANWLSIIHVVGLIYALCVTLFLTLMLKGRDEERYKVAALTDPLTGLANRRGFQERAQRVFDRCAQDANPVAIIAFDIDRFKRINDTFGHATGDLVLRVFADVLSGMLRPEDTPARIGGEEFVAVVPCAEGDAAIVIAGRVRVAFQKAARCVNGHAIEATVSAGVAVTGGQAEVVGVADLLARADTALYRAKNAGRNRVFLAEGSPSVSLVNNIVQIGY